MLPIIIQLVDLILKHIPVGEAKKLLDERHVAMANAVADAAEKAKFGDKD